MKRNLTTIILVLLLSGSTALKAQQAKWVKIAGSDEAQSFDAGEHIAIDHDGNILMNGYVWGEKCFYSGAPVMPQKPGTFLHGFSFNINKENGAVWGSALFESAQVWSLQPVAGGYYGCGVFIDSLKLGDTTLKGTHEMCGFIFSRGINGKTKWARKFGNTNIDGSIDVRAMTADEDGNVYITGMFLGTVTFGTTTLTSAVFDAQNYGDPNNLDAFLLKYDSSGNFQWVKTVRGPAEDRAEAIASDAQGNIYITGMFVGGPNAPFLTDFFGGATANTSAFGSDVYVVKLDKEGSVKWLRTGGGRYNDYGEGIDVDKDGNVYVCGDYSGRATFGHITLDSTNFTLNFLLSKYDSTGALQWIKTGSGDGYDVGRCVKVSPDALRVYVTGVVSNRAVFDHIVVKGFGDDDILFATYNNDGSLVTAKAMGGQGQDRGHYLAFDPASNDVFLTGYCSGNALIGNMMTSGLGGMDMFVARISPLPSTGIADQEANNFVSVYPNPANERLFISTDAGVKITQASLTDMQGKSVMLFIADENETIEADLSAYAKGLYQLVMQTSKGTAVKKILIH